MFSIHQIFEWYFYDIFMESISSGLKHFKIMISLANYTQFNKGTPLRMTNDNKYTYHSVFVLFQIWNFSIEKKGDTLVVSKRRKGNLKTIIFQIIIN